MRSETLRAAGVTPREEEIFWLVADRLHNREIAGRLHVSERAVESHVSSLLRKFGGENRLFLIDTAARLSEPRNPALPRPLSSFVGRTAQLEDLRRLLGTHRLVTLTGPAGAGKTRLALHLAAGAETLPAPVLMDLASVPPGGPVDRVFAEALGWTASAGRRGWRSATPCRPARTG